MTLTEEYIECYRYCAAHPTECVWSVLYDLRDELVKNGLDVPVVDNKPKKEVTPIDLTQDETFMLALMTALAEDDELWVRYQFVNPDEVMMEFYNEKYNNKTEAV